VPVRPQRRERS